MNVHTMKKEDLVAAIETVWPRTWAEIEGRLCIRRADGKVLAVYEDVFAADRGALSHILSVGFKKELYASPPIEACPPIVVHHHGQILGAFHTHAEADYVIDTHVATFMGPVEARFRMGIGRTPPAPPAEEKIPAPELPGHAHDWEPVTPESLARAGVTTKGAFETATNMRLCVACRTIEVKLPDTSHEMPALLVRNEEEPVIVED
jgi:hypothetical protein